MLITPIIMVMVGICEFISATVYRHKPWYWVALLFWVGSISCAFVTVDYQLIILSVCMTLGFVVPGLMLHFQAKKSHV